jgi:hypothetical protein
MKDMLGDLAVMARQIDCDFLVYLLEMAKAEAAGICCNSITPVPALKNLTNGDDETTADELAALFMRKWPKNH